MVRAHPTVPVVKHLADRPKFLALFLAQGSGNAPREEIFVRRMSSQRASTALRGLRALRLGRRLKDQHDASPSASRTHESALQTSEREVSPARPNECV